METLGHSSIKPVEESTVETQKHKDDDDDIEGRNHISYHATQGKNSDDLYFNLGERVNILDTGNVRLIPTSKGVNQEKKVETIYQAPDSKLHVKISNENSDAVKTPAHNWVDPDDPMLIAENELLGTAQSIEEAARKLASLKSRRGQGVSVVAEDDIKFDDMILEAAKSIANVTTSLIMAASEVQKELVAQGKVQKKTHIGSEEGQWSEGLVSAARLVAAATHNLCEVANSLVQGNASEKKLNAAAKQVSAATAQLLVACKVKADVDSVAMRRLEKASKAVRRATDELVKAAQGAIDRNEEESKLTLNRTAGSVNIIAEEVEARETEYKMDHHHLPPFPMTNVATSRGGLKPASAQYMVLPQNKHGQNSENRDDSNSDWFSWEELKSDPEMDRMHDLQQERFQIHMKTFTKWINSVLLKANMRVEDLFTDLRDGEKLLRLLEILSGKKLPKARSSPMRIIWIENVNHAFAFLSTVQTPLENMAAEDIVDGNPSLTLGLVWTIILRFGLQGIDIDSETALHAEKEKNAKATLLLWCQTVTKGYQNVHIKDFADSWQSGLGFNALIHYHRPDLINFAKLDQRNKEYNLTNAFTVAEKHLGITPLLDPDDMSKPDEMSIITYISTYHYVFRKM